MSTDRYFLENGLTNLAEFIAESAPVVEEKVVEEEVQLVSLSELIGK